jgi:hypothetical protein
MDLGLGVVELKTEEVSETLDSGLTVRVKGPRFRGSRVQGPRFEGQELTWFTINGQRMKGLGFRV